eukprot:31169-Pelagococcus_subviridis.AAC.8
MWRRRDEERRLAVCVAGAGYALTRSIFFDNTEHETALTRTLPRNLIESCSKQAGHFLSRPARARAMKEWYKWWFCVAAVLAVLAHCASPVAATYYGTYCVEPAVWYDVDGVCVYPGTPQYTVVVNRPGYVGAGAVGFAAGKASNYRPNYGRPDRPGGPGGDRPGRGSGGPSTRPSA